MPGCSGVFRALAALLFDREWEELARVASRTAEGGLRGTECLKLLVVLNVAVTSPTHDVVISPKQEQAEKDGHSAST
jgi:hypothetical protein